MGRMFRIITEGPIEAVTAGAALAHSPEPEVFVSGGAPYIEVGGPHAVFHTPKVRPPLEQTPPPKSKEFLSVAMNALGPKATPRVATIANDVVAFHQPNHAISVEYRDLASDLRRQVNGSGSRTIAFAAAAKDRGTTTVVLNLGVTLANSDDSRVLIVDADFEQAAAARKLGAAEEPGLAEALAQTTPLAWLVQPTAVANLQVLAAGRTLNPATLGEFPRVLAQLRQWFDWILVDSGTLGEHPNRDAALAAHDATYLVAREDEVVPQSVRQQVSHHGGVLRGFITTQL